MGQISASDPLAMDRNAGLLLRFDSAVSSIISTPSQVESKPVEPARRRFHIHQTKAGLFDIDG